MADGFDRAARVAVRLLTRDQVEKVADWVAGESHGSKIMAEVTAPYMREAISNVLASINVGPSATRPLAADRLRALADGYAMGRSEETVEVIWRGPGSSDFEATAVDNAFTELVREASTHLVFLTDSVDARPALVDALRAAVQRGVNVAAIVVDHGENTLSASALGPHRNLETIANVDLWRWTRASVPLSQVSARLAVFDYRVLLISSPAIVSGLSAESVDIGIIIRGGNAPVNGSKWFNALKAAGSIVPYR